LILLDDTDDPVVIISIEIPEGVLKVMAEVEVDQERRHIFAKGLHLHGEGFDPNGLGASRLRQIAALVLEELDCEECRIEGGVRTTGANPGR